MPSQQHLDWWSTKQLGTKSPAVLTQNSNYRRRKRSYWVKALKNGARNRILRFFYDSDLMLVPLEKHSWPFCFLPPQGQWGTSSLSPASTCGHPCRVLCSNDPIDSEAFTIQVFEELWRKRTGFTLSLLVRLPHCLEITYWILLFVFPALPWQIRFKCP